MYKCKDCEEEFLIPDIRGIDAGAIRDAGVTGKWKKSFVYLCPNCLSLNFEEMEKEI